MNLKTLFFPLSLIIAVFIVIWFIVPTWNDIQEKKGELGKLNETISTVESKIEKVNKEMTDYDRKTEKSLVAYDALPEKINNNHLVNELFTGAKEYGLLISSINTKDAKSDAKTRANAMISGPGSGNENTDESAAVVSPPVFSLPIDIELIGSYKDLKDFVGFIGSARRLLSVESVEITGTDKEAATGSVEASILATVFYKEGVRDVNFSSIVYNNDKVLESILQKGLTFDYLDNYKGDIKNTAPHYSPDLSNVGGKENLFSGEVVVDRPIEEDEGVEDGDIDDAALQDALDASPEDAALQDALDAPLEDAEGE